MLILKAQRDSLLKPLQAVTGIVERRHTLPILSNVLLENQNGQTKILATDLEIQIDTIGPASDAEDFRITTNAKNFRIFYGHCRKEKYPLTGIITAWYLKPAKAALTCKPCRRMNFH